MKRPRVQSNDGCMSVSWLWERRRHKGETLLRQNHRTWCHFSAPSHSTSFKSLCSWELPPVPPTRKNLLLQSLSKHLPAAIHSVIIRNNYITSWCLVNTYFVWCCVLDWNPLVFMLFATLFYRFYLLSSTL